MSTFSTTILSGLILYDSLPCLRDDQSQLECQSQFMEPNISQGSMATYATCGEILSNHFTANLLGKNENWLRFYRIMAMSLVCSFLVYPQWRF